MGEVYRARDTKLHRDDAIKVLPESFANDVDRLARFQREAQVLASLNHPNIAHIHGLEDASGVGALVMELVEGDDLAVLISRGPLPLADALPIANTLRKIGIGGGKTLSMNVVHPTNESIWTITTEPGAKPTAFADTLAVEKHSSFSPDGRWVAYMANTEGDSDVYVQPFPPTGAKDQIATGGRTPAWSPDGKQLFFHAIAANRFVVVDIRAEQGLTSGTLAPLPIEDAIHPPTQRNYDVAPDGKQLLIVLPAQTTPVVGGEPAPCYDRQRMVASSGESRTTPPFDTPLQPETAAREGLLSRLDLEAVIGALPILLFIVDADDVFVDARVGRDSTTLVPPEQFLGRQVLDVMPEYLGGDLVAALARARTTADAVTIEYTLPVSSGPETYEARIVPLAAGRAAVLVVEVTERRRLHDQLARSQRLESIGRLAGGVAHDFNNILTAILGNAELMGLKWPAGDPRRLELDEIVRSSMRARDLVEQLLAFAREQVLTPTRIDLNTSVREAERFLRRLLREDILFDVRLTEPLWPILADPTQLEQVLVNLVVNAADAMPGGGTLTISTANLDAVPADGRGLGSAAAGPHVALQVRDTGEGMTPDVLAHVFEPFFTTKPQGEGTGLGLATTYGIVEQSGGQIHVTSTPGAGSTFSLYFPRATA